ncbi:hypothetical protein BOTCAL_0005g00460 [Botryotinia calthae]|uniref:Uncharacterized protein n=1 Tax=Botryotinia calthae TaxID=38488 RepID=A0A4Y8DHP0_9HELO|nr:hypothetical protein BOTCAL_0005g00460 [Botryotinia calthae]
MSSPPSPESNGTSFSNYIISRPSEDVNMQSVPENSTYQTAEDDIPIYSLHPSAEDQFQSFFQRNALELAENLDMVDPRSIPRTNPLIDPTALSAPPTTIEQQLLQDYNPALAIAHELGIPFIDETTEIRHPTTGIVIRVLAFARFNARRRARGLREYRITRFQGPGNQSRRRDIPENQSRRRDITRRNQRARRNARGAASGCGLANPSRPAAELLLAGNLDADDEAVDPDLYLDLPLPDPAMNLDNFIARRDVRRQSALSNVVSTSDVESADEETSNSRNIIRRYPPAFGNMQMRYEERFVDEQERRIRDAFARPIYGESPLAASQSPSTSTFPSTSNSSTAPQTGARAQTTATATGAENTTVSSRKWSQNATMRLWEAMYQTNDMMQLVLESMREQPVVDEIPISKLSIEGVE